MLRLRKDSSTPKAESRIQICESKLPKNWGDWFFLCEKSKNKVFFKNEETGCCSGTHLPESPGVILPNPKVPFGEAVERFLASGHSRSTWQRHASCFAM